MHLATHRRVRQTMVTGPSSTYPFTTHPGVRFCFCFSFSPGSVRWQVASLHRLIFHPQILPRTQKRKQERDGWGQACDFAIWLDAVTSPKNKIGEHGQEAAS